MSKDEALRLALEALEYASTGNRRPEIIGPAITAIKQALEQPEPEPVVCRHRIVDITNEVIKSGYMCMDCWALFGAYTTSPPKREWQGLTDEDEIPWDGVDAKSFARAIEAKLKEKNHGIKGEA